MKNENIFDIADKAKFIYKLFFLSIIVFLSAVMICTFIGKSSILYEILLSLPSVIFTIAGILTFVHYDERVDNWANDHLLWQRNTFLVMIVAPVVIILLGCLAFLYGLVSLGQERYEIIYTIIPLLVLFGTAILIFIIWSLYRIMKGYLRLRDEETPYNSKR